MWHMLRLADERTTEHFCTYSPNYTLNFLNNNFIVRNLVKTICLLLYLSRKILNNFFQFCNLDCSRHLIRSSTNTRVLFPRQTKRFSCPPQYLKLVSFVQNSPYSNLHNQPDWSPVNLEDTK
jgi:hypothetical protein